MQLTHSVFFAFSFMQRTRKNVQSLLPLQTLKSLYSSVVVNPRSLSLTARKECLIQDRVCGVLVW